MKFKEKLVELDACSEAIEWVNGKGFKSACKTCDRGDWMLWYISHNKKELGLEDMRLITKAKAKCALLVKHLMKDERSIKALEVAVKFGEGEATREELDTATDAAYDATDATDAYVAAASYAANAAYAAASYTAAASYAAYAANAAYRKETYKKCADICREVFADVIKNHK